MSKRASGTRWVFAAAALSLAVYAAVSGYWLSSAREQNRRERDWVSSSSDEETKAAIQRECGTSPPPASASCMMRVEENAESRQHDRIDLKAQQDVAVWTFATFLTSLGALFFSAAGLWSLIWTFREQRKLTENQARAYIRIGWGELLPDPTYGLTYRLWLSNTGKTPAKNIKIEGHLTLYAEGPNSRTEAQVTRIGLNFGMEELPAEMSDFCQQKHNDDILDLPKSFFSAAGSHYRKTGMTIGTGDPEEDGVDERLEISGRLLYQDVFGNEHSMQLEQFTRNIESDGHLRGTGFTSPQPY